MPETFSSGRDDGQPGGDKGEDPVWEPEWLERLRRSGIRIDRQGELWHEGQVVAHQGLRRAIFRWLDRLPDGRYILRLDQKRFAYLEVEDTPLVIPAMRWADQGSGELAAESTSGAWLSMSDGSQERLDADTVTVDDQGILRCWVKDKRLEARFGNAAAATLAEKLVSRDGKLAFTFGVPVSSRSA